MRRGCSKGVQQRFFWNGHCVLLRRIAVRRCSVDFFEKLEACYTFSASGILPFQLSVAPPPPFAAQRGRSSSLSPPNTADLEAYPANNNHGQKSCVVTSDIHRRKINIAGARRPRIQCCGPCLDGIVACSIRDKGRQVHIAAAYIHLL